MSDVEAATLPLEGLEALDFLRQANIQPGERILINGAAGSIGTMAVQLAKHFGAEVTGVDSTAKLELLRSLGADHVIDYTQADFTKMGGSYDVIFDVIGKSPFSGSVRSLKPDGRYLLGNPGLLQRMRARWVSKRTRKQVFLGTRQRTKDLVFLGELYEAGKIKPVIDKSFPLAQTAEAHRYVESGQKFGNVVIVVQPAANL